MADQRYDNSPAGVDEAVARMAGEAPQNEAPVIDWASVQIPDEVIRQHPAYRDVVAESIERRHTIRQLREQMAAATPDAPAPEAQAPSQAQADDPVTAQIAALAETVRALASQFQSQQAMTLEQTRASVIQRYNIPEALHGLITGTTAADIENVARTLGEHITPRPHQSNLPPGAQNEDLGRAAQDELVAKALRIAQGRDTESIFSPDAQRAMGGGPVRRHNQ